MLQTTGEAPCGTARPFDDLLPAIRSLCDRATQLISSGQVFAAFRILGPELTRVYEAATASGREKEAIALVREHPLFDLCQQDPYTARAFQKPRGYAGDAVMMDFIYSGCAPEGTSSLGRQIFRATTRVPMGLSVLYRRSLLQSQINDAIARRNSCRILSVASGHCREVEGSLLSENGLDCELVALDQDPEALAVVARDFGHLRLRPMIERVKALVFGRLDIGKFDLVYSAGLYDYLPDATASLLTSHLYAMLRSGGRLLIANFLPSCYGRGYMDTIMDWRLKYRSVEELRNLFPEDIRARVQLSTDPHDNVAYAVVTRDS